MVIRVLYHPSREKNGISQLQLLLEHEKVPMYHEFASFNADGGDEGR
jgi:hypothetical protein